jgi:hypothetical protein
MTYGEKIESLIDSAEFSLDDCESLLSTGLEIEREKLEAAKRYFYKAAQSLRELGHMVNEERRLIQL